MKYIANAPVFAILYILLMLPTYFLPYLGSNSAALIAGQHASISSGGPGSLFFTFAHIIFLIGLVAITFLRAKYVAKSWLVVFPILGAIFDFTPGLSMIPLVPTVMHLLAIIMGVVSTRQEALSVQSGT